MNIVEAVIIAIVEGLTEFLPVSSTGHMIIAEHLMKLGTTPDEKSFVNLYTISIQLGAILAVVVIYWRQFFEFRHWQFYAKLVIGVLPALILGYFFADKIDELLFNPMVVSISMLAGGVVLFFIDKFFKKQTVESEDQLGFGKSLIIGCWQVLAMVPGVSRSAATIIGGMQQKLTRNLAAEFSFFLAVPTMAAATGYKLLKAWKENPELLQNKDNLIALALGNIVAFVVAMIAIKFFIGFLQKHGFKLFGWYRVIIGALLLTLILTGYLK